MNAKKTVFVRTVFENYNYGSVLQCFALQTALENRKLTAKILKQNSDSSSTKRWLMKSRLKFLISCLIHKNLYQTYKDNKTSSLKLISLLTQKQKKLFSDFTSSKLNVIEATDQEMKQLFEKESCLAVIAGSDQIWGVGGPYLNPINFLSIVPSRKKYSYAASIGISQIPERFKKEFYSYLKTFQHISVREGNLKEELTSIGIQSPITVDLDPTLLFTSSQWEEMLDISDNEGNYEPYILMYFLNKPSSKAIQHIQTLLDKLNNIKVYYFPYSYQEIEDSFPQAKKIELGPSEFVEAIKNSKCIVTDSFHGAVFSTIFHKNYYVYEREYGTGTTQNSRITNFLNRYGLEDRYITDNLHFDMADFDKFDSLIREDRKQSFKYIQAIGN